MPEGVISLNTRNSSPGNGFIKSILSKQRLTKKVRNEETNGQIV